MGFVYLSYTKGACAQRDELEVEDSQVRKEDLRTLKSSAQESFHKIRLSSPKTENSCRDQ